MIFPLVPVLLSLAFDSGPTSDALASLVEAERAFASTSVEKGMKEAFLFYLADDGIVFRPLPVNGKQVWADRVAPTATLAWEPAFAEIAAAGDLGYTTGPWELRPPTDQPDRPKAHGHFASVWRRIEGGAWRVALDHGISHDAPEHGVGSGDFTQGPPHVGTRRGRLDPKRELLDAEKSFAKDATRRGFGPAFGPRAAADVRFNREGQLPQLGLSAARAAVAREITSSSWEPAGVMASASGDLGATYGLRESRARGAAPDTSVWMHVWRKGRGGWKLALVVDNPLRR